jgi:pimeloyl-ACP methyl ester carboxylesterase
VGGSEGNFASTTLASLESDALISLIWLRANPLVDPEKIYVVGTGYGGVAAMHLASSGMVHGVGLLATPARSVGVGWVEAVRRDAEADGAGPEEVEALADRETSFLQFVRGTRGTWDDVGLAAAQAALPWMDEVEYAKRTASIPLPLLRDVLDVNPLDAVRAVHCALFILGGDKDADAPAADVATFAQAAKNGGNEDVKTQIVENLNHLLRAQYEEMGSPFRHIDEEVSWSVLQPLLNWMGGPVLEGGGVSGPAPIS